MQRPQVSIVMPIYNVEKYLEECLDSVLNQSLADMEIICIDDGSTDGSSDILDRYAELDSRVKVLHNINSGYGKTMNIGISMACGEYIGVVETDDYIDSKMMEELYHVAKGNNADVVKGDYCIFKGEGDSRQYEYVKIVEDEKLYGRLINPLHEKEIFKARINTWAGIYKREFLSENDIWHNETPGASYQDNGFWFQVFTQAKRVVLVNKPYYYLRRDNPDSSINSKEKVYCICDEMHFMHQFMQQKPFIYENYNEIFWEACVRKYIFNLKRVGTQYKLDFLRHMQKEFNSKEFSAIDFQLFSEIQKNYYEDIKEDAEKFWRENVYLPQKILDFVGDKYIILISHGRKAYNAIKRFRFHNLAVAGKITWQYDRKNKEMELLDTDQLLHEANNGAIIVVEEEKYAVPITERLQKLGFDKYLCVEDY